jgi:dipeptidyl aminopeptidase/acylaminoacyl peptidase
MPDPILRYLNIHQAYAPDLDSQGRRLYFLSNISGIPQIWRLCTDGGARSHPWPEQITVGADRVMMHWTCPAPDAASLIFARDAGGDERAQFFLFDPSPADEIPLTAGHEKAMHLFGRWLPDGRRFLFAANRRDQAIFDLYLQDLSQERPRLVWQNPQPGYLLSMALSPRADRALFVRAAASFQHDLFAIRLDNGQVRRLNPPDKAARFAVGGYDAHGEQAFLLTDLDSDFLYLARMDLASGEITPLVAPSWDVELMALSPDRSALAYTVNVEGASQLYLLDLTSGESRQAPLPDDAPGVVAMWDGRLRFSADSRQVLFSFTSAVQPSEAYAWDLAANRVARLTFSSTAGIPHDSFRAPELIRYPTFDGRQIPAWFYRPQENHPKPYPVILFVHGGPEAQFRPYFNFLIQYFLHHGYAVLAPNVRGSTGYGKRYSHLDDVEKRMDSVADLAHAAQWLRAQRQVDGQRLVLYGGSYGGFMVLAAMANYPDLWAAGVDIVGISNFVTFLENTSAYRRAHREAEYGSLERDRAFLERISPIHHVDRIRAPLMVIHGANDPRVPVGEARQIARALQARGVPVELLIFEDEGHGLVKLKNKQVAYPAIVRFLAQHLRS